MDTKSKCKIVYADDAMIHHVMMKAMAQSHSLELVYCASNGRDLIDYLIEHKKALPEVCILDLHMPILNGIETAKIVRDKFPSIRIFGLTSSSDEIERIEMLAGGAEQIFSKEEMAELLQQLNA
ncbi:MULTISPECIES: response regulator [unclassified Sphingobacterium]|uniref:response regulator n=1 Tax=unclassified Sphingobacterium TaxID=2609468 RepID=UPI0025E71F38|nr:MULTISPECIES: response regulator transcription factor [unclassified Sphingobacterium]